MFFMSWHVRVSMQHNVDVVRRTLGRYMLQAKLQPAAHEIEHEWPSWIAVAISSYDCQSQPDRAKLIENGLRANITQVPYFVSAFSELIHLLRQAVVGVRKYENAQCLLRWLF